MPEASRSLLSPGDRLDRYEILAEVAKGGMAVVYAARLRGMGGFDKILAVKRMLPHLVDERGFVDMFLDEARIAAAIHHPNVVEIFELGEEAEVPFIVMEYLRGQSLGRVLKRAKERDTPIPTGMALSVLACVADGLHAAHETRSQTGDEMHIVHRDVSPQNIHVGYDGIVKVVDFGIAAAAGRLTKTRTGEVKGKFHYMAPEQIGKQPVDRAADIWALGVVAWQLLSGEWLFKADDDATTLWNVMNLDVPHLGSRVPRPVADVVHRALDRNLYARPASARELAEVFRASARELGQEDASSRAEYMDELFASERAVENERLAAAMREGAAPPIHTEESNGSSSQLGLPTVVERPSARRRLRRGPLIAGAVALVVVAAAVTAIAWPDLHGATRPAAEDAGPARVASGVSRSPAADGDARAADVSDDESATSATEHGGEDEAAIHVEVSEQATAVLVDGRPYDERPVRLMLAPSETAEVEVFGPQGQVVTETVGSDDDGLHIELQEPERPRRRPRRGSGRARGSEKGSGILRSEEVF